MQFYEAKTLNLIYSIASSQNKKHENNQERMAWGIAVV